MNHLTNRLNGLDRLGFYAAPDNAIVKPMQIPDNFELVELITGGEVIFEINNEVKTFGTGTIFWHIAGEYTISRTTIGNPYRCIAFVFSVKDRNRPVPRVSFWGNHADIDRFTSECLNSFKPKKLEADIFSLYVYSTLLHQSFGTNNSSGRGDYPVHLKDALNYIHNNLNKKIPIEIMAKKSLVSQSHIFRLFQIHLNTTPHRYILSKRLLKARKMLTGTSLPIKVIANECGFESMEVFYRCFNSENSMPPGQYRRENSPYVTIHKFPTNEND